MPYTIVMRINVYVDSFNLYYGCLKGTAFKWLDVPQMCRLALPGYDIQRVRVFAARVKPTPSDPSMHTRQAAYFSALESLPEVSLRLGHFLQSRVRMGTVNPPPATIEVWKTEEKGSDVNLAMYLLLDAFDGDFEAAVVVSNDSDLAGPVQAVRDRFHRPVYVLHPLRSGRPRSIQLRHAATKTMDIKTSWLAASQLPPLIHTQHGTIHKPPSW